MTGVLIQARALSAYEEAVKDGLSYPGHAGLILGRELADGVLRLCDGGRTDA
jgi:hypothetical protein